MSREIGSSANSLSYHWPNLHLCGSVARPKLAPPSHAGFEFLNPAAMIFFAFCNILAIPSVLRVEGTQSQGVRTSHDLDGPIYASKTP